MEHSEVGQTTPEVHDMYNIQSELHRNMEKIVSQMIQSLARPRKTILEENRKCHSSSTPIE